MEFTDRSRHLSVVAIVVVSALLAGACASGGGSRFRAGKDAETYVRNHPAMDRENAAAMLRGEVVPGMTPDEVRATAGQPMLRSVFDAASGSEAWLLPTSHLSLGHYVTHNAPIVRIVFRRGRVIAVQPLI